MTQPVESDDAALIDQARSADGVAAREAWRGLYERYGDEVYAFLVHVLKEQPLAEDALQETFLRAFRNIGQLDARRSFRGWIRRIARNNAIDHLRSRQKARQLLGDTAGDGDGVVPEVARRESIGRTQRALARLSVDDRLLLLHRHGQGMRLSEIAEALACTERTVRNRLHRAAGRLAAAVLAEREGGDA